MKDRKYFKVAFMDGSTGYDGYEGGDGLEIGIINATPDEVAEYIESFGFKLEKDVYGEADGEVYYGVLEKVNETAVVSILDGRAYDADQLFDELPSKSTNTVIVDLHSNHSKLEVPSYYIRFFREIFGTT